LQNRPGHVPVRTIFILLCIVVLCGRIQELLAGEFVGFPHVVGNLGLRGVALHVVLIRLAAIDVVYAQGTGPFQQGPHVVADPRALRQGYLEEMNAFRQRVRRGCLGDRIDFVEMDTSTSLDVALSSYLARRAAR